MNQCTHHCPPHCDGRHHHGPQVYTQQPILVTQPQANPVAFVVGGCPSCRVGVMQDEFTVCGIILAILFFPIGVLCCWVMRERRCSHCGATFGA